MSVHARGSIASSRKAQNLAAKHRAYFGWALLWLAGLLILIQVAVSVAQALHSTQLGVMASALTLLMAIVLRASLTSRRRR